MYANSHQGLSQGLNSSEIQMHYEKKVISIVQSNDLVYCEIWQIHELSSVYNSTKGNKSKFIVPYIMEK